MTARGSESAGIRQLRHYRAAGQRPAMIAMRDLARLILARRVAHRHLGVERPLAAGRAKSFNEIGLRCGRDHSVGLAPRETGGLRSAGCANNRGSAIGAVVQLRVLEHEVRATVVFHAALEQPADDVVGLGKPLVPLADAGPALANDVLVQPFAGAEPEGEAVLAQ